MKGLSVYGQTSSIISYVAMFLAEFDLQRHTDWRGMIHGMTWLGDSDVLAVGGDAEIHFVVVRA